MSTLWTPGGERPVSTNDQPTPKPQSAPQGTPSEGQLDDETLERMRAELASTPASVVVANHCFGLFELAALHLSLETPQLDQAKVAIDAMAAILDALEGRLGDVEPQLREGIAQIRLAFVKITDMVQNQKDSETP